MEEDNLDKDVLLLYKKIEIEHELFCFKLKENSHLQYLLISQNTSSILLPSSAISCFLKALDFFSCNFHEQQEAEEDVDKGKELKISDKVFYFNAGQDKWGPFVKVSEVSASTNCGNLIIPCGKNKNNGLELFRTTVAEIDQTLRILFPPYKQTSNPLEQVVELADARTDDIASHVEQSSSASQLNIRLPHDDRSHSFGDSRMMRVGQKRFFFDLGNNKRGHFLKISEVMGAYRSLIIIPLSELKHFHAMVGHFLENIKIPNEGLLTSKNVGSSSAAAADAERTFIPLKERQGHARR